MPKAQTHALARAESGADVAQTFERMAKDPNVDVEKFERLVALFERGEARKAETAFNAAMTLAQHSMRPVAADAFSPSTRSRFASYAALDEALRPIYTRNGFALSFNTVAAAPDRVLVTCLVSHELGHSRPYQLDLPADGKGAKGGDMMTKTHAVASACSYAMRYLLRMIFNIAIAADDDDGNRAGGATPPLPAHAPEGFDEWWTDMQALGDEGTAKLSATWNRSNKQFRAYLTATNMRGWEELKKKAAAKEGGSV